jgi:branched-chain amino acid aminotransferase
MPDLTASSAQSFAADPRNASVLIHINGTFFPRDQAVISVFDSGFSLGDGVWEGLRMVRGRILEFDAHLDRLIQGATALAIALPMGREGLRTAVEETFSRNGMTDGAHARLMVTRGLRSTPNQDPKFVTGGPTVVVVAEWKAPNLDLRARGLTLFTSVFRTSPPDVFDMHLNTHSRLNLIQALIQAQAAGADEALMLDPRGFVASCNSTNFFCVRGDSVWTSTGSYSFRGITQGRVIKVAREAGMKVVEADMTLAQVYNAQEAFVTGTLGGVTPVTRIDGRPLGTGKPGPVTTRIRELYEAAQTNAP